ncbi:amino acid adenylation domain-containing protein [Micromonospora sp. CA-263727]|uniref:amino acid adenylation domain-containing protein n=1 Tax=Micromonospora sp. CA-263727 TaxID=3239967 RepID=UPI003D8FA5BC
MQTRPCSPHVLAGPVRALPSHSVVEQIHWVCTTSTDTIAIEAENRLLSYGQLGHRIVTIGRHLRDLGVGPGDRVALWAQRTPDTIAAALAIMSLRAAYVPIEPTSPPQRVRSILLAAEAVAFASDGPPPRSAAPHPAATVDLSLATAGPGTTDRPASALPEAPHAHDVAYVIFTSGSTGSPKGVLVEHRSLANYTKWCADLAGPGGWGGGTPVFGSLGYDHSMTSLWPTLISGGRLVLTRGVWDAGAIFGGRRAPFALMKVTPSHLRVFERSRRPVYHEATRMLVIGGELLEPQIIRSLSGRLDGVRLINHYGPTETTVGCCYHEFAAATVPDLPSVPIGGPIWNTRAYLVDEELRPVAAGQPAELVIAGHGVAAGYVGDGDPGLRFINEAELGGPPGRAYRTGDRVELLPSGQIMFLGREDDQVKVNGYRVELSELGRLALAIPGVLDIAFELSPDHLGAFETIITTRDDRSSWGGLATEVRRTLAAHLPPAVVPRRVHVVDQFVLDANGKRDLRATRRLLAAGQEE